MIAASSSRSVPMPSPNIFQRPAPRVVPKRDPLVGFEVRRALLLHQAGQVDEAVQIYEKLLGQHPQQFESLHFLAVAHIQGGRHDQAAQAVPESKQRQLQLAQTRAQCQVVLHQYRHVVHGPRSVTLAVAPVVVGVHAVPGPVQCPDQAVIPGAVLAETVREQDVGTHRLGRPQEGLDRNGVLLGPELRRGHGRIRALLDNG